MNEVINLLKSHKSIRKFKPQAVEEEKVKLIIECAQSASTSSFMQAYTIIRVDDKEKRSQIAQLAGDQKYVEECPLFLVFCADLTRLKIACRKSGMEMDAGYTELFIVSTVDAALAAQNAIIAAESMGLGGVYIGGIRNNPQEMCTLLDIPVHVYPVFGMCIGYPAHEPSIRPRMQTDLVFKKDTYSTQGDNEKLKEYDEIIEEYYAQRAGGKRTDTWTNMISSKMSDNLRTHMKGFLEKQGFYMK